MHANLKWIKGAWIGLLLVFFLGFSTWYGGNGKPISAEEGAELLRLLGCPLRKK